MFAHIIGALTRGILVAALVATPSLLLPASTSHAPELVALLAILAACLTVAEYNSGLPSFVEFRDAPPYNRLRFAALGVMLVWLSLLAKNGLAPSPASALFAALGRAAGTLLDFPYSPVRLVVLMLSDVPPEVVVKLRDAAGAAYLVALLFVLGFWAAIRLRGWPLGAGAFNVWVNLPLFDPTAGGDVVRRLQRDGRVNMMLGALLPFLIPAGVFFLGRGLPQAVLQDPQTMIWTVAAWAFLPASLIMRGLALHRVADLIEARRRRVYAESEALQAA